MITALVALGIAAGVLTSLAGQGGGLFLLLACSFLVGPHAALAVTSPALLFGNVHRAWMHRGVVNRAIAGRMIIGALPGAAFGGLLAGVMPTRALDVALVLLTVLAIAKAAGLIAFSVPRQALAPAGFGVGAMTGTAGGAGVLFAPILLSVGLSGPAFVGTVSVIAVATHIGRIAAYAAVGLFGEARSLLGFAAALALAIFAGNALAERIRPCLSQRATTRLEYGTLIVCVGLSVLGVG